MGVDPEAGSGMQFDQVEAPGLSGPPACAQCHRPLDEYFALGGAMFCRSCVDAYKQRGGSFGLALLYGAGAALLGTLVWFAIIKIFNSELAIVGIAVGLFVGFAVRKGARGVGGWKFQALAMALTYVSITASYMPLVFKGMVQAEEKATKQSEVPVSGQAQPEPAASKKPEGTPSAAAVVLVFLLVFAISLAAPFLGGADNFIGWIIIGIALYEAWKLNRRVPITGPFRFGGALSVPAPVPVTPGPPAAGS